MVHNDCDKCDDAVFLECLRKIIETNLTDYKQKLASPSTVNNKVGRIFIKNVLEQQIRRSKKLLEDLDKKDYKPIIDNLQSVINILPSMAIFNLRVRLEKIAAKPQ